MLKALYLLKEASATVNAIAYDGDATNRLLQKELGIYGVLHETSHSFIHPIDVRKVFFFSDAHNETCVDAAVCAKRLMR